jgi:signal transduction histidine kinase
MQLSRFIRVNIEPIVAEWEAFARSMAPPNSTMDIAELRDHAKQMLLVIANDLETPQTNSEGKAKAKGHSDAEESTPEGSPHETPAQAHGTGRAESGFDVAQMVSEYRALRASVVRLWTQECGALNAEDVKDLVRFSEAIDQALAESTGRFTSELERTREIFLGVLGHDLRTPLSAIVTSALFTIEVADLPTATKMAAVIVSSGNRMTQMVDDLLDFTRGRLGARIPVAAAPLDLKAILWASVEEMKAARPETAIYVDIKGDLRGEWDGARLSQVWSNLLGNAVDHGAAATPITLTARGEATEVVCSVHNQGRAIPEAELQHIFDPMSSNPPELRRGDHLGLGLYIAGQIVKGHGGWIDVDSNPIAGTTFTVHLPRAAVGSRDRLGARALAAAL